MKKDGRIRLSNGKGELGSGKLNVSTDSASAFYYTKTASEACCYSLFRKQEMTPLFTV